jgi:hypothetical protein
MSDVPVVVPPPEVVFSLSKVEARALDLALDVYLKQLQDLNLKGPAAGALTERIELLTKVSYRINKDRDPQVRAANQVRAMNMLAAGR